MRAAQKTMTNLWCVHAGLLHPSQYADSPQSKRRRTSTQAKPAQDDTDSELSDVPLKIRKPPKATAGQIGESDDSDTPLTARLVKEKESIQKAAEKEAKAIRAKEKAAAKRKAKESESESDDDVPLARTKKQPAKRASNGVKKGGSSSDAPLSKKKAPTKKFKVGIHRLYLCSFC
jgi:DNA topoisomerase I